MELNPLAFALALLGGIALFMFIWWAASELLHSIKRSWKR